MQLFVGLGNPGDRYAGNRHNIGFMAVEAIAERHRFGPWKKKFQALAADGEIDGVRVLLLKPDTYMNESGRAVGEACRFLKIGPAAVVAIHDELDLKPGEVRIKSGGGNAGHNGLRSMTAHIGNDYRRLRLGIGHPGAKELVSGYVLSDFAKADRDWLAPLLAAIADEAALLAAAEDARFAAAVVKRLAPAKSEAPAKAKGAGGSPSRAAPAEEAAAATAVGSAKAPGGGRGAHPAGERAGKRQAALADNLRKWLAAHKKDG